MYCNKNKNGLLRLRNSPFCYPTLVHLVPWHLGHGGNTSELSSNLITSPHFTHLYKPFPGFSPVVYINLLFKKLIKTLILLTAFFHRTNFNFFRYSCLRSFSSFFRRDKLSASCISNTSRSFTHKLEFLKLTLCFHLKGLKAYPRFFCSLFDDLQLYLMAANYSDGQFHPLTAEYYGQFPIPLENLFHKMVCTLNSQVYPFCTNQGLSLLLFGLFPKPRLSFVDTTYYKILNSTICMKNRDNAIQFFLSRNHILNIAN